MASASATADALPSSSSRRRGGGPSGEQVPPHTPNAVQGLSARVPPSHRAAPGAPSPGTPLGPFSRVGGGGRAPSGGNTPASPCPGAREDEAGANSCAAARAEPALGDGARVLTAAAGPTLGANPPPPRLAQPCPSPERSGSAWPRGQGGRARCGQASLRKRLGSSHACVGTGIFNSDGSFILKESEHYSIPREPPPRPPESGFCVLLGPDGPHEARRALAGSRLQRLSSARPSPRALAPFFKGVGDPGRAGSSRVPLRAHLGEGHGHRTQDTERDPCQQPGLPHGQVSDAQGGGHCLENFRSKDNSRQVLKIPGRLSLLEALTTPSRRSQCRVLPGRRRTVGPLAVSQAPGTPRHALGQASPRRRPCAHQERRDSALSGRLGGAAGLTQGLVRPAPSGRLWLLTRFSCC